VADEDQIRKNLYAGGFVIAIMFIIFTMPIIVDQCEKRKRRQKNTGGEEEKKKVN
jgi:H+/gluconate symporter-like permease